MTLLTKTYRQTIINIAGWSGREGLMWNVIAANPINCHYLV